MVIKLILILMFYSGSLLAADKKEVLFENLTSDADEILKSDKKPNEEVLSRYEEERTTLEELEYQEGKVDQIDTKVKEHLQELENIKYRSSTFAFLDYNSWQQHASLKLPSGGHKSLIISNNAWCGGGGVGKENSRYHIFADACFLYGRGDVAATNSGITYHQRDVYGRGMKVSVAAGMFVSSSKAEVGFKVPMIYFDQTFGNPNQSSFPGYKVKQSDKLNTFVSLYSKWPFDRWFIQTEFGKMIGRDLTLWSAGLGYKF